MREKPPEARLVPFIPRPRDFETRVRKLAADSRNVRWSQHARERMQERDIPIRVALSVLREGMVVGKIEAGKSPGEWKAKIVRNAKGSRDVGVIAITVREDYVRVATVEWEDLR